MKKPIRLMTLAPGHFHAALVQRTLLEPILPKVYVYAPLDTDLILHLQRILQFNLAAPEGATWELDIRAGEHYFERFLKEQPGNVVVIAGKNRQKIEYAQACVANNLNVLMDKPWIIDPADFPKLEQLFQDADLREVIAYDILTERFELTNILQRELIRDPEIFGEITPGTPDHPGLSLESIHYLSKTVNGEPLRRPAWWFDADIAGEALADVGTHLADLIFWLLWPEEEIDYRTEIQMLDANNWPTLVDRDTFQSLTGLASFPEHLSGRTINNEVLQYSGNGMATLCVRGVYVRLTALWEVAADHPGGDIHEAIARGTRSTISIQPDTASGYRPGITITPASPQDMDSIHEALTRRCASWNQIHVGVAVDRQGDTLRLRIPNELRTGHESHFTHVMRNFIDYFHAPRSMPAWERSNLLARYFITTQATALARQRANQVEEEIQLNQQ